MIVATINSPLQLPDIEAPATFSAHFKGGAIHTLSVTIDGDSPISLTGANPSRSITINPGSHECRVDIVVIGGDGALNRHYGIMLDVNGICFATSIGDIPVEKNGDTGHALLMIEASS